MLSDGLQEILKGAATSGTIVSVGGLQTVLSGGSIWIAVLFADGVQILRDGAEVYGATVSSDGSQVVSSGCSASGCRIQKGERSKFLLKSLQPLCSRSTSCRSFFDFLEFRLQSIQE